jgi:hypothetical protein
MKSYKIDQRGITHNLMLAGIAVLVLGAIGFAGFRVYKSKNDISAKADTYRWAIRTGYNYGNFYDCKARVSSTKWLVRSKTFNYSSVGYTKNMSGEYNVNGQSAYAGGTYTTKGQGYSNTVVNYFNGEPTRRGTPGIVNC